MSSESYLARRNTFLSTKIIETPEPSDSPLQEHDEEVENIDTVEAVSLPKVEGEES